MIREFENWCEQRVTDEKDRKSRISRVKRCEKAYGNLEEHFTNGTYQKILDSLEYSTNDKKNKLSNPSRINIRGDVKTGLASLKDALKLYLQFLKEQHIETLEEYQNLLDENIKHSLADSIKTRAKRLKAANQKPKTRIVKIKIYDRNPDVIAETLLRANGICDNCKNKAPFNRAKNNTPFLEVHHKIPLANGGKDTIENAIALCPNCHRKAHYG